MPYRTFYSACAALALAAAALPAAAGTDSAVQASGYVPGRGFDLPLGFRGGGYIDIQAYDLQGQDWTLTPHDLSLFLFRDFGVRWHLFSEIELGEPFAITRRGVNEDNAELDIERLYVDYDAATRMQVRIGKFLTPVGRWNLIFADPLTWSVTRPLTTTAPFANHASGVMVHGTLPVGMTDLDYSFYGDASEVLNPSRNDEKTFTDIETGINPRNAFESAVGARFVYRSFDESMQIGLSLAHFRLVEGPPQNLVGTDVYWAVNRMQFSGEAVYRTPSGGGADEWGGFVQAVVPVPWTESVYLVGYHERFKAAVPDQAATIESFGVTFVPHPAMKIKLERRDGRHNQRLAPDGWFAVFSMLL